MKADVLTLKVVIDDKEKAGWIWEMMRQGVLNLEPKKPLPDLGISLRSIAWGNTVGEQAYVLDRISRYLNRWDRADLLQEMGMRENHSGDLDELGGLIEIWEKEARKKHGSQINSKGEDTEEGQLALASKEAGDRTDSGIPQGEADRETSG